MDNLYTVLEVRHLTDECISLKTERKGLEFKAGQCVNIGPPELGVNREYSLYCGENDDFLQFLIKVVEGGQVSPKLQKLKEGDSVEVDGAYGLFTIKNYNPSNKYVFIGTGTGIAPFRCFASTYPDMNYQIIHGVRYGKESYDRDFYAKGSYVCCTTQDEGGDFKGRVTDYLRQNPVDPDCFFYLCGNRMMLSDVFDLLVEQDVSGDQIFTEAFF